MMGDIIAFRTSTPTIYVDGSDAGAFTGWFVNVRPCPVNMPTLRHFDNGSDALDHALALQRAYGWGLEVACDCGLGGAA